MSDTLWTTKRTTKPVYSHNEMDTEVEEDLKPYLSLFLKPLTSKKSKFPKPELEVMCQDPLHSPGLILYLIDFVRKM
ncbi:MAG: hypothetical protein A2136_01710 [Chloroflexi bacterium RBG_16_54_11]|nr:MAG: hypothetical protein A2136_01710 [Chloroflexi bacterium RBG_16_54_11]